MQHSWLFQAKSCHGILTIYMWEELARLFFRVSISFNWSMTVYSVLQLMTCYDGCTLTGGGYSSLVTVLIAVFSVS